MEEWKLQAILEAIHRAPRVLEIDFLRAVVMRLKDLSDEQIRSWQTPTTTTQLEMVPVILWVFADLDALENGLDGENLHALMRAGALNESHGWTPAQVEERALPYYRAILDAEPRIGMAGGAFSQDEDAKKYSFDLLALARTAVGIGQAYALLTAVELGLGVQLSALPMRFAREQMKIPDAWISASPVFIGYAAEAPGGQRPREPLEETISEGRYGRPFLSDPRTVERLRFPSLIQEPAPTSWRRAELRRLARMFGLPE
ncbi:MAG: hypothetical protein P8Y95_06140 [Gammaproteobacteria bacterium]